MDWIRLTGYTDEHELSLVYIYKFHDTTTAVRVNKTLFDLYQ